MWAHPDDTRSLLAPDQRAADYVAGIYAFDRIEVVPFRWTATPCSLELRAGPLEVDLAASGGRRLPLPRPWWFTSEPPPRPNITDVAVRIRRPRPGPRHGAEDRRA